jgi:hypothetical protein
MTIVLVHGQSVSFDPPLDLTVVAAEPDETDGIRLPQIIRGEYKFITENVIYDVHTDQCIVCDEEHSPAELYLGSCAKCSEAV